MKNIEFWFSIGSTYTYLSVQRIFEIEENFMKKLRFNFAAKKTKSAFFCKI